MNVIDSAGYREHEGFVNHYLLTLAAARDGLRGPELGAALQAAHIGDAKSASAIEIAYSSTGAIARAALREMMRRGMIALHTVPSGRTVMVRGEEREGILSIYRITQAGRERLAA